MRISTVSHRSIGVVLLLTAVLALPAAARADSGKVTVTVFGAGSVRIAADGDARQAANCPASVDIGSANTDSKVCSHDFTAARCLTGTSDTCDLTGTATAILPKLDPSEATFWKQGSWQGCTVSPTNPKVCTYTWGHCTAGACTFNNVALSLTFKDTHPPTARFGTPPPALVKDRRARRCSCRGRTSTSRRRSRASAARSTGRRTRAGPPASRACPARTS